MYLLVVCESITVDDSRLPPDDVVAPPSHLVTRRRNELVSPACPPASTGASKIRYGR